MIEPDDEARLIGQLGSGGRARDAALEELFQRLRQPLFGLALRMTGRPDLADDAVQEALVDVLRGIPGFRGDARLTTWAYRIAVRAATRVAARNRRAHEDLSEDLAAGAADPQRLAAERDGAARILAAIAKLPAPMRAVVALSALDGLDQTEVAEVLGVPVGTVYSRLHAARARLRELLGDGDRG